MKKSYQIPYAVTLDFDACDILTTSGAEGQKGGSNGDFYGNDCFGEKQAWFRREYHEKTDSGYSRLADLRFCFRFVRLG